MADHLRRQIREAVATTLTGLATTGAHVFQNRVYPLQDSELPALRISTGNEDIEIITMGGAARLLQRTLQLTVEGAAKAVADLDDTLDGICREVEVAMANTAFSALARDVSLSSVEIELSGEGEQPIGVARMQYRVVYVTAANAPDISV